MFRKIIVLVFAFVLVLSQVAMASAKIIASSPTPVPETASEVNSFELFWPISAGKTMGDSLYFLKTLKENLRGMIIFGNPEKADYAILLATKRSVEAEKLIGEGKTDLANKTLEAASHQIDSAQQAISQAISNKEDFQGKGQAMADRLRNIAVLNKWLNSKNKNDLLVQVSDKASSLANKIEGK